MNIDSINSVISDNNYSFFMLSIFLLNLYLFFHCVYYMESKYIRESTNNIFDFFGFKID